jgi:hypothetical protein
MAAGTKKSDNITNIEASPIVILDKKIGIVKRLIDEVELAVTNIDDIGDIILFGPLPSNAVVSSIKLFNDDLDTNSTPTLAADVGVYYSGIGNIVAGQPKASGVVVDADCIGTAITTLQAANVSGTELRFEAANIDTIDKELWEVAGLTADCGGDLYIGLTLTAAAATGAAGGVKMVVDYV